MSIDPKSIHNIHSREDFLKFLSSELAWPVPEDLSFDDVTFDIYPSEVGIRPEDLRGSTIAQLRPFVKEQPWGIFILQLKQPRLYLTELRKILRALEPMKRKLKDFKTWNPQHILFICTNDWKSFTIAHFDGEKADKAKLSTFGWEYQSSYIRTLCEYNLDALKLPESDLFSIPPATWLNQWSKAFDVKSVTDKFYDELKKVYTEIQSSIKGIGNEHKKSFAQLLLNRLLFLKFLERKGWLFVRPEDSLEERRLYLRRQREKLGKQNQWQYFFHHLFFKGLNRPNVAGKRDLTPAITNLIGFVPFLNGGLFEKSDEWNDDAVKVDNEVFNAIFDRLLDRYNFTIQENTPLDVEVALNPDLLGYAYEELIAERHGQGAFYTHPIEVGLMCRESLKAYLEEHTTINHPAIAKLIDDQEPHILKEDEAFSIYRQLLTIKILDPAIGSGAYPVRMMQELAAIHRALGKRMTEGQIGKILQDKLVNPRSIFDLKLSIIQNNLYGVDIDRFAVEIAKLRFWLSLVVEYRNEEGKEIETPKELDDIPALPNLDFKLRIGDSLVATPGRVKRKKKDGTSEDALLNLDTHFKQHSPDAFFFGKTNELRELKEQFFHLEELRKNDPKYYQVSKDDLKKQIAKKESDLAKDIGFPLQGNVEECKHILWQIHFAEIFNEDQFGFDICIANPPYLRQELINDIFKQFEMDIDKDDIVTTYESLYRALDISLGRKSDLYIYFYLRGINVLRERGVLCFICSNSWLDVGYGAVLQDVLLRTTRLRSIIDNSTNRSFEKADVNTTINLFIKDSTVQGKVDGKESHKADVAILTDNIVHFVAFRGLFEATTGSEAMQSIASSKKITSTDDYRVYPIAQKELWKGGLIVDEENQTMLYEGDKWGSKYLRAPDIFFTIMEKGIDSLVRLGDIAEVRRGFTTGANEFFYLDEDKIAGWGIEKEFLRPAIKSPRECKNILIDSKHLKNKIFMCHKDKKDLKGTKALKYIEWGEEDSEWMDESTKKTNPPYLRPSCIGRELWWDLGKRPGAKINCNYLINEVMRFYYSENPFFVSDNFQEIHSDKDTCRLTLVLNSTLVALFINMMGRANFGGGLMKIQTYEVSNIKLIDPSSIKMNSHVECAFSNYSKRSVTSVYEEYGIHEPTAIRSQEPNPLPDRKALDEVVFDVLGLTKTERNEVYWAVCELVQNRLNKAKSM